MALTLGAILFTDFEIPEELPFGGAQMLSVKKLVGGDRVVDAMGRDDEDLTWSGRFRGDRAEARARELDALRIAGQELVLAWSTLRYLVVIKNFRAQFQQPFEIPYSITCLVLEDLSNPILVDFPSADAAIGSDINAAGLLAPEIGVASITGAVANVSSAAALVTSYTGTSAKEVATVRTSVLTALTAVNAQADSQNGIVEASGSVAGAVAGLAPQTIASALQAHASGFNQLGQLYQLRALLGRVSLNIANAGS